MLSDQMAEEFLAATYFLDYDTPSVSQFADTACNDAPGMRLEGDFGEDGARERAGTNHP
jgi:hypothetical protein